MDGHGIPCPFSHVPLLPNGPAHHKAISHLTAKCSCLYSRFRHSVVRMLSRRNSHSISPPHAARPNTGPAHHHAGSGIIHPLPYRNRNCHPARPMHQRSEFSGGSHHPGQLAHIAGFRDRQAMAGLEQGYLRLGWDVQPEMGGRRYTWRRRSSTALSSPGRRTSRTARSVCCTVRRRSV